MKPIREEQIQGVLKLDGLGRYKHFVKRITDSGAAWGLWKDGWALMATSDGAQVFPLWPAREYAELFRVDEWEDLEARAIPLDDLLDELLPSLKRDGILPAVFPIPRGQGGTLPVEELEASIRQELENYE